MPLRLRRGLEADRLLFVPEQGEPIYTTDTSKLYIGDGITPGGVQISALSEISENSIGITELDVSDGTAGQVLSTDGAGNLSFISVSSLIVDNTFTGNFVGTFDGDIKGSVFADDSTTIIDGQSRSIIASSLTTNRINSTQLSLYHPTLETRSELKFILESASDLSGNTDDRGRIFFARDDTGGQIVETTIGGGRGGFYVLVGDDITTTPLSNIMYLGSDGNFGLGTFTPNAKLTVEGNGLFAGEVTASSFKGTYALDDSTIIIDGENGNMSTPGTFQFGSFTNVERDALGATNGTVIYNTTVQKFQGYQNGGWINLDDGSAG